MSRWTCVVACVGALCVLAGCAGSNGEKISSDDLEMELCPYEWFVTPPSSDEFLYATATFRAKNGTIALDAARSLGKDALTAEIETRCRSLTEIFMQEIGQNDSVIDRDSYEKAVSQVVTRTLLSSNVEEQRTVPDEPADDGSSRWRTCVLMSVPRDLADAEFVNSINENEELRIKFEKSQFFQRLDEKVRELEG